MNADPVAPDRRFASLAELRGTHSLLLRRYREEGATREFLGALDAFLQRGRATGTLLDEEADRWAAQGLLDYWASALYTPGAAALDTTLDEHDPSLVPAMACPYRGLEPFGETDHNFFFGRRRLSASLVEHLRAQRLLILVGSSGSGKSSLVRGGLVPLLKAGALPSSAGWRYLPAIVPGSEPLAALADLFAPGAEPEAVASQVEALRRTPTQILDWLGDNTSLLVVDQFEELFTLCYDAATRDVFVAALLAIIAAPHPEHRLVLTIRSDFVAFLARIPEIMAVFEQVRMQITPLSVTELREAVELPAALVGLKFEEGVVDALLQDMLGEPAALPLLQFSLLKLWETRQNDLVTLEAYHAIGGGRLALARSADTFYQRLIPEDQVTVRRLLLQLVVAGTSLEVTSRRVRREKLFGSGEDPGRIARVLAKLVDARLVRLTPGATSADDQVEIAHEALVRNWPTFVDWIDTLRVELHRRARVSTAAQQWQETGHDPGALLRGALLAEALGYDNLGELETTFVEASWQAEAQAAADREAAQQRELEQARALAEAQRRANTRLRWIMALSILLLSLPLLSSLATAIRDEATRRASIVVLGSGGSALEAYEVTNGRYAGCVRARVCSAPSAQSTYFQAQSESFPVTGVDAFQSVAFCQWIGRRLPTHAEWRDAATQHGRTTWPWGNEPLSLARANLFDEGQNAPEPGPRTVGSYPQGVTPEGIYDLVGNVWEWTATSGDEPVGAQPWNGEQRTAPQRLIVAGGGFDTTIAELELSSEPATSEVAYRSPSLGFRCAAIMAK